VRRGVAAVMSSRLIKAYVTTRWIRKGNVNTGVEFGHP
jgi:hypothetical protein